MGIEVTGRRRRRRRKLLDGRKDRKGYCHLKEEALDRSVWRAGFGRGFGLSVRQTAVRMISTKHCNPLTTNFRPHIFRNLPPSPHCIHTKLVYVL